MIKRSKFFETVSTRLPLSHPENSIYPQGEDKEVSPSIAPNLVRISSGVLYERFEAEQLTRASDGGWGLFCMALGGSLSHFSGRYTHAGLAWTNMRTSNYLPPPEAFMLGGIMVSLDCNTPLQEAVEFGHNVVGSLLISGKVFREFPLALVTTVTDGDLTDVVEPNPAGGVSFRPTDQVLDRYLVVDPPIYIAPLQWFDVVLRICNGWKPSKDLAGYVYLDGMKTEAVS